MCDYWDTQLPENLSTDTLMQSAGELYQDYKQLTRALLDLTPGGSEYHNSPQRCLDWIKDRMAMTGKIAKERNELRAQRDDLLAACALVEWVKDPEYNDKSSSGFGICYCPWCGNYENYGHDKNCQRQAAIARAKGGE